MVGVGVAVLRVLAAFPKFQSGAALGAAFAVGFFWNLFAMRRAQLLRPGLQKSRWNGFLIVVSEFLLAAAMTVLLGIFGGIAALLIFTVFAG